MSDSLPIGQQLRTAREAAGLRQYALAAKAGIPQTYLSDIERGKHHPSNATLFALADALSLGIVGRTGHWQLVPGEAIEELLKKYPEVQ